MSAPLRLIIFVRYPSPSKAKTRLIPALGAEGAARLQHDMTQRTLAAARSFAASADGGVEIEVRGTGGSRDEMRARYGNELTYADQGDGDLGERLHQATIGALARGAGGVIIIGSDCPGLTAKVLTDASQKLRESDVVLGPACDGGYYLIGCRRSEFALYSDISWGTDQVLAQTLVAAHRAKLSVRTLEPLADIDRPADLAAWHATIPVPEPYAPNALAITGSTGCLGVQFLRHVLERLPNIRIAALVRRDSPAFRADAFQRLLAAHPGRVLPIDGDLRRLQLDAASMRQLCDTDGGLWHFAARTTLRPRDAASRQDVHAVNDGGTARLLALLASRDCPGPLLHVSTAYVCGRRTGLVYEETLDDVAGFRNDYEASKWSAECRVRDAFGTGLRGAVFRPSVVIGGSALASVGWKVVDQVCEALLAAVRRRQRELCLRVPQDAAVNIVHAEWVVQAMLALGGSNEGRTFHLTSPRPMQFARLAATVADHFPGFTLRFAPDVETSSLLGVSRALDRALSPLRDYLEAGSAVTFDRGNVPHAVPDIAAAAELDVDHLVRTRLKLTSLGPAGDSVAKPEPATR